MAVHVYGRWFFAVDSHSREGMEHFVDLEPQIGNDGLPQRDEHGNPDPKAALPQCSCEAWSLRCMRPCRHIDETNDYIVDSMRLTKAEREKLRQLLDKLAITGLYLDEDKPKTDTLPPTQKPKKRTYKLK